MADENAVTDETVEEKTEATFSQGVLTVSLPKTKKRKRVSIKTEQGEKE